MKNVQYQICIYTYISINNVDVDFLIAASHVVYVLLGELVGPTDRITAQWDWNLWNLVTSAAL